MGVSAAERFLLRRPALEERLDESFGRRVTLLVAGAGYGKSTLIAQWAEELESAWYTVSSQDQRLSSFAAGIAGALRPQIGELPGEYLAALAGGGDELAQAEVLAAHLSEALESSLAHDLILVLDDAHEVAPSAPSLRLIESLCRQAPGTVHLVVASRETLDLRVDRLRAQGEVAELTSADLAFALAEVGELSLALLGENGELAARIQHVAGGWPVAVRFAIQALTVIPPGEQGSALDRLMHPGGSVFSFLAHEVFERESPDVQSLIRMVAPLERFTVELCEALGIPRAYGVIDGLVRRGLFVQAYGDAFALHALVREFANSSWPLTAEEERSTHLRAAAWFESQGRFQDALSAFAAASHDREIVRMLEDRGQILLASGGADTILRFVDGLPPGVRSPAIEQLLGEALLARGDFDGAIACFEQAATAAGSVDSGLAWRIGMAHHFRGDLDRALKSYARAERDRGDGPDDALLLAWAASVHAVRDEIDKAIPLAQDALDIATRSQNDRAVAAANVAVALVAARESRYLDSDELLRAALAPAERCGDLIQLARIRTNLAASLTARGSFQEALAELDEAMGLAEVPGFVTFERVLTNRGGAHLRLGFLDEAGADYAAVVELSRSRGSQERGFGFIGLGDVHRERGNLALARAAYEQGLPLAKKDGTPIGIVTVLCGLARVLVDDAPSDALRLAEQAVHQRSPEQAWALNAAGWVALALGAREEAAEAAIEAAIHARERSDRYALAEALELQVFAGEEPKSGRARLEEALAIWRDLGSRVRIAECELALARLSSGAEAQAAQDRAVRKLRALGVRVSASGPAGLLRTVAQPTPALIAVQALGGFQLLRGGRPVLLAEWRSKKARDLLKILVGHRGRPVPREVLMETLWPDGDPQRLGNRLSVALSTLRSVLDPERQFDAEHFVRADRESITLDLGRVLVDVEVFLHEAEKGLLLRAEGERGEAAEWLAQAESTYAGDALEEDPYADWSVPLREEARSTYITVTHALAGDASTTGDGDAAIRYFHRILGHDPHDERAHLGLVSTLEQSGRRGEARRSYRGYVARMEEIGATPSAFPIAPRQRFKGS